MSSESGSFTFMILAPWRFLGSQSWSLCDQCYYLGAWARWDRRYYRTLVVLVHFWRSYRYIWVRIVGCRKSLGGRFDELDGQQLYFLLVLFGRESKVGNLLFSFRAAASLGWI